MSFRNVMVSISLVRSTRLPTRGATKPRKIISIPVPPGKQAVLFGFHTAVTCSFCVWDVGAQRVRDYGCSSNAPTSTLLHGPEVHLGHGDSSRDPKTQSNTNADPDANPLSTGSGVFRDFPWRPR
jgi:hypothetical protein